jgi:hypothetical protein
MKLHCHSAAFLFNFQKAFLAHILLSLAEITQMKALYRIFTLMIISLFSVKSFAQKALNEGVLTYNITIQTVNGEKPVASALNGAVLTIYLTKDKSRTEMVSAPGTETTVFDNKENKGFILKEYSGQKLMITTTGDNWSQKNQMNRNLSFTDGGTTTINGIACKKATAQSADGKIYTVYYDPTIVIANKEYNNAFPQIHGLPVQFELSSGNLIFRYTLSNNSSEIIAGNKFDAPKAGFRVMTYEENQQLKKGE